MLQTSIDTQEYTNVCCSHHCLRYILPVMCVLLLCLCTIISLASARSSTHQRTSCQDVLPLEPSNRSSELYGYLGNNTYNTANAITSSTTYGLLGFSYPFQLPETPKESYSTEFGVKFAMCDGHNVDSNPRFQLGLFEYSNQTVAWNMLFSTGWNTLRSVTDVYQFFQSSSSKVPELKEDSSYRIGMAVSEQTAITVFSTEDVSAFSLQKLQAPAFRHRSGTMVKSLPSSYVMPQGLAWLSLGMTISKRQLEL
jgi:hypothetical protein